MYSMIDIKCCNADMSPVLSERGHRAAVTFLRATAVNFSSWDGLRSILSNLTSGGAWDEPPPSILIFTLLRMLPLTSLADSVSKEAAHHVVALYSASRWCEP